METYWIYGHRLSIESLIDLSIFRLNFCDVSFFLFRSLRSKTATTESTICWPNWIKRSNGLSSSVWFQNICAHFGQKRTFSWGCIFNVHCSLATVHGVMVSAHRLNWIATFLQSQAHFRPAFVCLCAVTQIRILFNRILSSKGYEMNVIDSSNFLSIIIIQVSVQFGDFFFDLV